FAHHKKGYIGAKSNGISQGVINKQIILCITSGDASPILSGACSNAATNTPSNSGGIVSVSPTTGTYVPDKHYNHEVGETSNTPYSQTSAALKQGGGSSSSSSNNAPYSQTSAALKQNFTPMKLPFTVSMLMPQ
ncbi:MAG TPA: hypothetical protein VE619_08180, partial [Nitrososphaeraceae archaeon]|nr:hypothetical protein [Nitrososphaeraceae archaeon]